VKNIYSILFFLLPKLIGYTQDIHWSQINENALYLNPANTGYFEEDFRVSISVRDQWRNVTKPYQSQTISFDMVNKYNRKLGYGGNIIHDITGDGFYRTIEARLNTAYSFINAEKYKLRLGLDLGWKNNQMDFSKYMFDNQYDGFTYLKYKSANENYSQQKKSNLILGTGIIFCTKIANNFSLTIGTAVFNINEPNQGFYNEKVIRNRRFTNYMQGEWSITKKIKIYPNINFTQQNSAYQIIVGTKCKYEAKSNKFKNNLIFGTYIRNRDALILQIGLKIDRLTTSMSYDINYSKLAKASNGRGALEIHLHYLWSRKIINNLMHKKCLDYL
jgi:type IX secretion system PorP/SprF family membrane protein